MKKTIGLALITVLTIASISGCTPKASELAAAQSAVPKDGTYSVVGKADQRGWVPEISITVSEGKITAVKYDEAAAIRKSESIEYQTSFKAQNNIDLLTVYTTMQNGLIKSQDVAKLDTVTGATKSAENFKALAADALKNAKVDNQYIDGSYTAAGTKDEKNWTPTLTITIKDKKIAAVKYDEVSSKVFKYKSQDKAYVAKFQEQSKLDLLGIYETLYKNLLEKQDPAKLDAIAGATQASNSFVELSAQAIAKAKEVIQ